MKNWLNDIDARLLEIRNEYGSTYYRGFKTGKLDSACLGVLAERQMDVLSDPEIPNRINRILLETDSLKPEAADFRRKSVLLRRLLESVRVEKHPVLVSLKAKVQQDENEFVPAFGISRKGYSARRNTLSHCEDRECRRKAFLSLQPLLGKISDRCCRLVAAADSVSSDAGYSSYYEFLLAQEDMTVSGLHITMNRALQATEDSYLEFLAMGRDICKAERISEFDLPFTQGVLTREVDRLFSQRSKISDLKETLDSMGIDPDMFHVSMETVDSPNAGTCFVLGSEDIRIILGSEPGYFGHYVAFHEFGHALHYSLQPQSTLLSDTGICMETMADFFATLLTDHGWLSEHTSMTPGDITEYFKMKKLSDSYRIRSMIRDTMFESEIFTHPGKSFHEVRGNLTERILGVQAGEPVWSPFSMYRPAYVKNYVYSHLLSHSLDELTTLKHGNHSENQKRLLSVFTDIASKGNLVPFQERLVEYGIDYSTL